MSVSWLVFLSWGLLFNQCQVFTRDEMLMTSVSGAEFKGQSNESCKPWIKSQWRSADPRYLSIIHWLLQLDTPWFRLSSTIPDQHAPSIDPHMPRSKVRPTRHSGRTLEKHSVGYCFDNHSDSSCVVEAHRAVMQQINKLIQPVSNLDKLFARLGAAEVPPSSFKRPLRSQNMPVDRWVIFASRTEIRLRVQGKPHNALVLKAELGGPRPQYENALATSTVLLVMDHCP
ncbi:Uncharacterized protein HZ326_11676 [Fusarium oxysporum f. sp. albedinis]|nr:Uncharacterized protein HZ326_11676 [Fusarium oxysporum f. sp. albedinis]